MKITWKITHKWKIETVWQKQTEKQSIVVTETENEDYKNNSVMIDFFGEWLSKIEKLEKWDIVTAYFNIKTREYNGKVFNSITGRKVELVSAGKTTSVSWWDDLPF